MPVRAAVALLTIAIACAADLPDARIVYSKSFPGSRPAYVEISVERNGQVIYKEAPDDDRPITVQLDAASTSEIFGLAEKLGKFNRPLETPTQVKIAFMGMKMFRWENGKEKNETKFNYTADLDARALHDWFERITESEQRFMDLERTARFDRLGVNDAIIQLHISHDKKRLVAPDQFLPLLDRVAKNSVYLNIARERAALLARTFRAALGKPEETGPSQQAPAQQ